MSERADTGLLLLQHGDSFFPSGGVAFSHGLETLKHDGLVTDQAQVGAYLEGQLRARWSTFDWGVVAAVWRASPDLERITRLDGLTEAMTLARALRDGSRRAGAALLTVHERLRTPGIGAYATAVREERTPGHLAVVQTHCWKGVGLGLADCGLLSAHTFSVGVLGAALRLGLIGHLGAQSILKTVQPLIREVLSAPPPSPEKLRAYTPLAEIATMRHETQTSRLFSN